MKQLLAGDHQNALETAARLGFDRIRQLKQSLDRRRRGDRQVTSAAVVGRRCFGQRALHRDRAVTERREPRNRRRPPNAPIFTEQRLDERREVEQRRRSTKSKKGGALLLLKKASRAPRDRRIVAR